jgi:hypothetical protein
MRSRAGAATIFAAVAMLLSGAVSTAHAVGPPIETLTPKNGEFLPLGIKPSDIRYTCPAFEGNPFADQIIPSYRGYEWRLARTPSVDSDGLLAFNGLADLGDAVSTGEDVCEAYGEPEIGESAVLTRGTYFFQASRSVSVGTREPGPITEFSVGLPKTLPGHVTVYLGCGLGKTTKQSGSCEEGEKIGAFYRSSKNSVYTLCVAFPGGREKCKSEQNAKAGHLYVNKVTVQEPGPVIATWKVLRGPTLHRALALKR